jgi:hypothetical protein
VGLVTADRDPDVVLGSAAALFDMIVDRTSKVRRNEATGAGGSSATGTRNWRRCCCAKCPGS